MWGDIFLRVLEVLLRYLEVRPLKRHASSQMVVYHGEEGPALLQTWNQLLHIADKVWQTPTSWLGSRQRHIGNVHPSAAVLVIEMR